MPRTLLFLLMVVSGAIFAADTGVTDTDAANTRVTQITPSTMNDSNPFARPSTLPYQLPPFDRIKDADYMPAFTTGMAQQRHEIDAIARNPQPPSFDNTIVAMERTGQGLGRVSSTFYNLAEADADDEMLKIEADIAPKLAAHQDAIYLDPALFARVEGVYRQRALLHLNPESAQLLERYHVDFLRAGAQLGDADKATLRQLNQQLSSLTTQFRQNVLKATQNGAVVVAQQSELDGLSPQQIGAAAAAAKARGLEGKWLIALQNTTTQPVLAQLKNRALRERIYRASIARGAGGAADNGPVIAHIVRLRAERAELLGYPTHAAYVLADETAATPAAVNQMLRQIAPAAFARAREEAAQIQQLIDVQATQAHIKSFACAPWDWAFYSEQVRKAHYDFDATEVKPYFELEHVLQDGLFFTANQLYGLTFKERKDLPVYHPDVRIFEVFDADGSPLALFLTDYFARDSKNGGAWMNSYVRQSKLLGLKAVVANHLNIPKPAAGQPVLLSFDEVTSMFHEFGHALHGMFSEVQFPSLSGTQVPRDFVEYPSQFNEMWAREPAVLAHFARHYQTGERLPEALLHKVLAAQKFNQGFATGEYLAAAMLDQAWYQLTPRQAPVANQVAAFESAALKRDGVAFRLVPPRYHSGYFLHIFADEYSGGYYAYLWSEVLARDTGAWFHQHGGLTRSNGDYFRAQILSRGRVADPKILFQNFYGHPPDTGPLLRYRGLSLQ